MNLNPHLGGSYEMQNAKHGSLNAQNSNENLDQNTFPTQSHKTQERDNFHQHNESNLNQNQGQNMNDFHEFQSNIQQNLIETNNNKELPLQEEKPQTNNETSIKDPVLEQIQLMQNQLKLQEEQQNGGEKTEQSQENEAENKEIKEENQTAEQSEQPPNDNEQQKPDTTENDNENNDNQSNEQINEENQKNTEEQPNEQQNEQNEGSNEQQNENQQENNEPENVEGMTVTDNYQKKRFSRSQEMRPQTAKELPLLTTDPTIERRCRNILEKYKKNHKTIDIRDSDLRHEFHQFLNREKVNMVAQEKYSEAHELQEIARSFSKSEKQFVGNEQIDTKIKALEKRIQETDNDIKFLQTERDKKLRSARMDAESQRNVIKNRQKREVTEFEDKWNNMDFLRKFTKPSPMLLQLMTIEKSTVCGKMFDKAEEMRNLVTKKEKEESELAQERAFQEMSADKQKLTAKHNAEMQAAENQFALIEHNITTDYDAQIATLNNRRERLVQNIADLTDLKAKGVLPPLRTSVTSRNKPNEFNITPRTINRFALCKSTMRQPKVSIKPMSEVSRKKKNKKLSATL